MREEAAHLPHRADLFPILNLTGRFKRLRLKPLLVRERDLKMAGSFPYEPAHRNAVKNQKDNQRGNANDPVLILKKDRTDPLTPVIKGQLELSDHGVDSAVIGDETPLQVISCRGGEQRAGDSLRVVR